MKKIILILFLALGLAGCGAKKDLTKNFVILNGHQINLELAVTEDEQYQGLSNRESLPADTGMLFVFAKSAEHNFVMRDMKFPLDIIWLKDNVVVDIKENLPPEGHETKMVYTSKSPANKVLEINAGQAKAWGLKTGQIANFNYAQ